MGNQIVKVNDGSIDVQDILCTTYQMRNFYHQFRDGFFSDLDMMNYIQHLVASRMLKKDMVVLDVCCGRSLMIPLLRYNAKDIKKYIGVDIEERNLKKNINICNGKEVSDDWYPFEVEWIVTNVSSMSNLIKDEVDFIIYTSAIEHMHKEEGIRSLQGCASVIKKNGLLFISCPNTPENQDGYSVQYKAHVYEWKISELQLELEKNGFYIKKLVGISGNISVFKKKILVHFPKLLRDQYNGMMDYLPREILNSILFINYPEFAKEILIIAERI